jgi:glycosyltransferase 2 family protein
MASASAGVTSLASSRWRKQQIVVGLGIGAVLLTATLRHVPISEIAAALKRLDLAWAAAALACYAVDLALRAIRWRILLGPAGPGAPGLLARALVIGYGLNILLPARLGELARIEYLKVRCGTKRSGTLPSILLERSLDGFIVVAALVAGLVLRPHLEGSARFTALAAAGIAVAVLTTAALVALRVAGARFAHRLPEPVALRLRLFAAAARGLDAAAYLKSAILTLAIYGAEAGVMAAMLHAVGVAPHAALLLVLLGTASLSTLLPTAPGYLGSYQLAFAIVFGMFAISPALGAAAATAIQALLFAPLVLASIALLLSPQRASVVPRPGV